MKSYITAENILVFCEGILAICFSFHFIFLLSFLKLEFLDSVFDFIFLQNIRSCVYGKN